MTGSVSEQGLEQLQAAKVGAEELLRRRRDRLTVVDAEIGSHERALLALKREVGERRAALFRLYEERGRLAGYLDARRLNGATP